VALPVAFYLGKTLPEARLGLNLGLENYQFLLHLCISVVVIDDIEEILPEDWHSVEGEGHEVRNHASVFVVETVALQCKS
jgi:hypothetical protein